eukprot:GEZU01042433.1.p2 GENE.GEZU01042433.1~~GEZU01042433.1.p2  ORF type:complete len:225 (-),score=56.82 GEZU01042433.1:162-776(-)
MQQRNNNDDDKYAKHDNPYSHLTPDEIKELRNKYKGYFSEENQYDAVFRNKGYLGSKLFSEEEEDDPAFKKGTILDDENDEFLYKDLYLELDQDKLRIKFYYFPFGSKVIPLTDIKDVRVRDTDYDWKQWCYWGMRFSRNWFHFDPTRTYKHHFVELDTGKWIIPAVSPDNHILFTQKLKKQIEILNAKQQQQQEISGNGYDQK